MSLAVDVNRLLTPARCRRVPGLRKQAIDAANSIVANIAEACGRQTDAEFKHFLGQSLGSNHELDTELQLIRHGRALDARDASRLTSRCITVRRMTESLIENT